VHKKVEQDVNNLRRAGKKGLQEYQSQKIRNKDNATLIAAVLTGSIISSEGHSTQPLVVITPVLEQTPQTGPDPLLEQILFPLQLPGTNRLGVAFLELGRTRESGQAPNGGEFNALLSKH
jgi:hypothetical protein